MAKRLSASSRPEKLRSVKAEDIFNRPLTKRQRSMLQRLDKKPESEIDTSDIPPLSDEQLARMVRGAVVRPPAKQLLSVRVDRDAVEWLKSFGAGYLTRINAILRGVMEADRGRRGR